jgi:nicotinate-nucleotide adenylyltransferase
MTKTGLFFGSFNPIHTGHLLIANYFLEFTELDNIWFVVSPQNPFKQSEDLLDEKTRLQMLRMAVEDEPRFIASDIEFDLERPSYTVNTLRHLRAKLPAIQFFPIIGGDNLQQFHLWKDYKEILDNHQVYVYRRAGFHENPLLANHSSIKLFEVPLLNISSTYVRDMIQAGKSVHYMVPENVRQFIEEHKLYLDR